MLTGELYRRTKPELMLDRGKQGLFAGRLLGEKEHRAVMLQHLETVQVIMNALIEIRVGERSDRIASGLFYPSAGNGHSATGEFPACLSWLGYGTS